MTRLSVALWEMGRASPLKEGNNNSRPDPRERRKSSLKAPSNNYPLDSRPGARFSKVPIINGPGKLSPFTLEIKISIVWHLT